MTVNIMAILIANLMGLMIIFVVFFGNKWQSKTIFKENKSLKALFLLCLILCIDDPICFLADGKDGWISFFLVYFGNLILFIGNTFVALFWCKLIMDRLKLEFKNRHKITLCAGCVLNATLLIINFFNPIIFHVNYEGNFQNNVYQRGDLYWMINVFYLFIMVYALVIYFFAKLKDGNTKFFPIWAFLVPTATGFMIQFFHYGVSTVTPFITVALICVFINLQNEFIYRDKLTGLYNRFYLDIINKTISKDKKKMYSAMMLDLNGFKAINDTYGHDVGDKALILFSNTLTQIVSSNGEIVRYAGDEFIVFLRVDDENTVNSVVDQIHARLETIDKDYGVPYKLTVAIGHGKVLDNCSRVDEFIDEMDKSMYIDKNNYYKKVDRRKKKE